MDDAQRLRDLGLPDLTGSLRTAKGTLYQKTIYFGETPVLPPVTGATPGPDALPRDRLLAAATELFIRHGLPNVTLEQIGQASGLTRASLMHLCLSKEDVFHQVLSRQVDAFVTESLRWVDAKVPAPELIRIVAERSFQYIPQRPLLLQLLIGLWVETIPEWGERLAHLRLRCTTGFSRALEIGIAQKVFRPGISLEMVSNLLMDLHAASYLFADSTSPARVIQRRNAALDLIFNGLFVRG